MADNFFVIYLLLIAQSVASYRNSPFDIIILFVVQEKKTSQDVYFFFFKKAAFLSSTHRSF